MVQGLFTQKTYQNNSHSVIIAFSVQLRNTFSSFHLVAKGLREEVLNREKIEYFLSGTYCQFLRCSRIFDYGNSGKVLKQ